MKELLVFGFIVVGICLCFAAVVQVAVRDCRRMPVKEREAFWKALVTGFLAGRGS